mgnify:FL=1
MAFGVGAILLGNGVLKQKTGRDIQGHLFPSATPTVTETPIASPTPTSAPAPSITPTIDPQTLRADIISTGRFVAVYETWNILGPGAALVIYLQPTTNIGPQIEALDPIVSQLIEPGDEYIYYIDTLRNGSLYSLLRCEVQSVLNPPADSHQRSCKQWSWISPQPSDALADRGLFRAVEVSR